MGSYKLSQSVDIDLDKILDYGIDQFGLERALQYYDSLQTHFDELADTPLLFWQLIISARVIGAVFAEYIQFIID